MRPALLAGVLSGLSTVTASFAPAPAAKAVVNAARAENIIRAAFSGPDVLQFAKGDHEYFVIPPKFGSYGTKGNSSTGEKPLTRKTVVDVLLNRRQSCAAGYGYCASAGGCCPSSNRCCSYGYCLEPGNTCCPNGPCDTGELCCGQNHCYPTGAVCCDDESYCDSGNHCYHVPGYTRDVCCTDSKCTAYYTDGATVTRTSSTTRSTTTPPAAATTTPSSGGDYYTFTYTYIYYSYYWSSRDASVRVVRSTDYTTTTKVVVYATDTDAATSEYDDLTVTLSPYTPAAATSLRAQAGETTTLYDDQTATFGSVALGTTSTTSTSRRTTSTSTTSTATPTLNVGGGGGGGTSGGSRLVTASNRVLTAWAVLGAATGILMAVL